MTSLSPTTTHQIHLRNFLGLHASALDAHGELSYTTTLHRRSTIFCPTVEMETQRLHRGINSSQTVSVRRSPSSRALSGQWPMMPNHQLQFAPSRYRNAHSPIVVIRLRSRKSANPHPRVARKVPNHCRLYAGDPQVPQFLLYLLAGKSKSTPPSRVPTSHRPALPRQRVCRSSALISSPSSPPARPPARRPG